MNALLTMNSYFLFIPKTHNNLILTTIVSRHLCKHMLSLSYECYLTSYKSLKKILKTPKYLPERQSLGRRCTWTFMNTFVPSLIRQLPRDLIKPGYAAFWTPSGCIKIVLIHDKDLHCWPTSEEKKGVRGGKKKLPRVKVFIIASPTAEK